MSRCLHLVPDSTYLNWFRARAEQCTKDPQHYVRLTVRAQPATLLEVGPTQTVAVHSADYRALQQAVRQGAYEKIIVHYLSPESAHFLRQCGAPRPPIIWVFWGGDFYYLPRFWRRTYHDFSRSYKQLQSAFSPTKYHWLRTWLGLPSYADVAFCLQQRVDYCATFLDTDFAEAQRAFPKSALQRLDFHYQSLSDLAEATPEEDVVALGEHLLLGNSADPANNHWEAMCALGRRSFRNPILCPLSYGEKEYSAQIVAAGEALWGEQFIPLTTYLPRKEYNALLKKVGYAVFNHRIQQGVGNLLPLLARGVKVFMGEESTLYTWLKQRGIRVFSVEQDLGQDDWLTPLSHREIMDNQRILKDLFSEENTVLGYQRLLN